MKNLGRKLACLVLLLAMTLTSQVNVFATEVNANNGAERYKAYQIFTGTYDKEDTLKDVQWGTAGTGYKAGEQDQTVAIAILDELSAVKADASDRAKYAVISKYFNEEAEPIAASADGKFAGLPVGYYIIKDESKDLTADEINFYVVQVSNEAGSIEIIEKRGTPSVDKEVSDDDEDKVWNESADHEIGEIFQFKLTATVPAAATKEYLYYYLQFVDHASKGIYVYEDSFVCKVNGKEVEASSISVNETETGTDMLVTFNDIFTLGAAAGADATVEIVYDAMLTEDAIVTDFGTEKESENVNNVFLKYSRDFNYDGKGEPETGETPDDNVWVFTYRLPGEKVKVDGTSLAGAEFKLYRMNGETKEYYNYDGKNLTWTGADNATVIKCDDNGLFHVNGVDAGQYYLEEYTVPTGYNKCDDILVTITAKHSEVEATKAVVDVSMKVGASQEAANKVTVVNHKGSFLPETGGIGTTIFYLAGGCLVVFALASLLLKKRARK